jgi:hypothetical protein
MTEDVKDCVVCKNYYVGGDGDDEGVDLCKKGHDIPFSMEIPDDCKDADDFEEV